MRAAIGLAAGFLAPTSPLDAQDRAQDIERSGARDLQVLAGPNLEAIAGSRSERAAPAAPELSRLPRCAHVYAETRP